MKEKAQILTRNIYLRGQGTMSGMKRTQNLSRLSDSSKDQMSRTQMVDNSTQRMRESVKRSYQVSRASALQLNGPDLLQKEASNSLLMIQKSTIHVDAKSNRNNKSRFALKDAAKASRQNRGGSKHGYNNSDVNVPVHAMSPF